MNLFNTELGAKARTVLQAVAVLAFALVALLQEVADTLDALPDWGWVGLVLTAISAVITVLGRFTRIGDPPEGVE
jgi:hypothetical protein